MHFYTKPNKSVVRNQSILTMRRDSNSKPYRRLSCRFRRMLTNLMLSYSLSSGSCYAYAEQGCQNYFFATITLKTENRNCSGNVHVPPSSGAYRCIMFYYFVLGQADLHLLPFPKRFDPQQPPLYCSKLDYIGLHVLHMDLGPLGFTS